MADARDIEFLYDLWEQNICTLRTLHRHSKAGIITKLVAHLRSCAIALVKQATTSSATDAKRAGPGTTSSKSGQERPHNLANPGAFAATTICVMSRAKPASFAEDHPLTPTTCVTPNPEVSGSRSAANSWFLSVPFIIANCTKPQRNRVVARAKDRSVDDSRSLVAREPEALY
jgi:hypothetical protein